MNEHKLKIGQEVQLRRSFFRTSWALVYAGMPSDQVYSLAVSMDYGYQAKSFNLFIPVNQRELHYMHWRLKVTEVNPEFVRLSVEPAEDHR